MPKRLKKPEIEPMFNHKTQFFCLCLGFKLPFEFYCKNDEWITLICRACKRVQNIGRSLIAK